MKRYHMALLAALILGMSLVGCSKEPSVWEKMTDFVQTCGLKDGESYTMYTGGDCELEYNTTAEQILFRMSFTIDDDVNVVTWYEITENAQEIPLKSTYLTEKNAIVVEAHVTDQGLEYDRGYQMDYASGAEKDLSTKQMESLLSEEVHSNFWDMLKIYLEEQGIVEDATPGLFLQGD